MSVAFEVEIAEQRVVQPEQILLVDGNGWDARTLTETYQIYLEPLTKTLMLRPLPLTREWQSTATGDYARFRKSDTNRNAHSAWTEFERGFAGNYFMHANSLADNHADRVVSTTASFPKNCPFYISWWIYNYGGDRSEILECGWTTPGSGVSLRFWSDRQIDIYKGANYLATLRIENSESSRDGTDFTLQNLQAEILLIPCRRRSLVMITNLGGNAVYEFDDLDPENDDNTITPAGAFWYKVPRGTVTAQFARCRFRDEGFGYSTLREFRYAPESGTAMSASVFYDPPGFGTVSVSASVRTADGTADFVPDGVETQARVRVALQGDGFATPFVYGAVGRAERRTAETPDEPNEVGDYVEWSVGQQPDSREITVSGRDWRELETILTAWRTVQNRSCRFVVDGNVVFAGRTLQTNYADYRPTARAERWTLQCSDRWRALELQLIRDTEPLDGLELSDALQRLAIAAGLDTSDLDMDSTGFQLPTTGGTGRGEWAVLSAVGQSYADAMIRLWRDYAATWRFGFQPGNDGYKLRFKPPLEPPYTIARKIYLSRAAAVADGVSPGDASRRVAFSFSERTDPPECNEIILTGWDPQRRLPFQRVYKDTASQDPTLSPTSRPANWLGEVVPVGLNDYTITTISAADRVLELLQSRLTVPKRRAELESWLLTHSSTGYPLWCDDVIHIHQHGLWRVIGFSIRFEHEATGSQFRRARYELEYLSEEPA